MAGLTLSNTCLPTDLHGARAQYANIWVWAGLFGSDSEGQFVIKHFDEKVSLFMTHSLPSVFLRRNFPF